MPNTEKINKTISAIIFFVVFAMSLHMVRLASASTMSCQGAIACCDPLLQPAAKSAEKHSRGNTPVFLNADDFLTGLSGCCYSCLLDISGPSEKGTLLLSDLKLQGDTTVPASLLSNGLSVVPSTQAGQVTFSWSASSDGMTYTDMGEFTAEADNDLGYEDFRKIYSSISGLPDFSFFRLTSFPDNTDVLLHDVPVQSLSGHVPFGSLLIRDNLVFIPEEGFVGEVPIDFQIVSKDTTGEKATLLLKIALSSGSMKAQAGTNTLATPKNYTITTRQGSNVPVGKTLKKLASKSAEKVCITALPDSSVGVLAIDAVQVQSGQEIPLSQLASLNFNVTDKYYFGKVPFKWQVLKGSLQSGNATMTMLYNNIPDPPTTADTSKSIETGSTISFAREDFPFESKDNDTFKRVKIKTLPDASAGTLEYNGKVMKKAGSVINVSSIDKLLFRTVTDFIGTTDFSFYVGTDKMLSREPSNFFIIVEDSISPSVPTLLAPFTATINTKPSWGWTKVLGATSYDVKIDNNDWTSTTSLEYTSDTLSIGTHSFSLRARNNISTSQVYTYNFDVTADISKSIPELTSGLTATALVKPTWTWKTVSGASFYKVKINSGSWVNVGTALTYTAAEALPIATHTFSVMACNSAVDSQILVFTFTVVNDMSALVPDMTVDFSTTSNTKPTWNWNALSGATSYEVKTDSDAWVSIGDVLTYTLPNALAAGAHTFSLRARSAPDSVSQTVQDTFTIGSIPQSKAVADISGSEATLKSGTIDLSDVYVDPNGYSVSYGVSGAYSSIASISVSGNTLSWTATGIGTANITFTGTSKGGLNSKTWDDTTLGAKNFDLTITAQATTLGDDVINQSGTHTSAISGLTNGLYYFYVPITGLSTSLLTESQIKKMITIWQPTHGLALNDGTGYNNNANWGVEKANDRIRVQFTVADSTKCENVQIDKKVFTDKVGNNEKTIFFTIGTCP